MTERNSETTAGPLGGALQSLLVSGIRISVAVNLYALEQIQKTIDAARGHGLPAATKGVVSALDTLSDSLENGIDDTKKDALQSVRRVATKAAERSFAIFSREAEPHPSDEAAVPGSAPRARRRRRTSTTLPATH